jgi:hypothetical protein
LPFALANKKLPAIPTCTGTSHTNLPLCLENWEG